VKIFAEVIIKVFNVYKNTSANENHISFGLKVRNAFGIVELRMRRMSTKKVRRGSSRYSCRRRKYFINFVISLESFYLNCLRNGYFVLSRYHYGMLVLCKRNLRQSVHDKFSLFHHFHSNFIYRLLF
jgi:hypothetical protein